MGQVEIQRFNKTFYWCVFFVCFTTKIKILTKISTKILTAW